VVGAFDGRLPPQSRSSPEAWTRDGRFDPPGRGRNSLEAIISPAYRHPMPILNTNEIARLSPPERLALIGDLWDSLADAELPTSPTQCLELERRLAAFDQDQAQATSWEQLKAELAARTA
jgi:putative addiction module component (TIGR02574 family)